MMVFDTETRIDATQRLTFGSYRFLTNGECQEEGLFFANDLPEHDRQVLERYATEHPAEANNKKLKLLTLNQFLSKFYSSVYKGRCLLVGFNLPFDLSRVARDSTTARGRFAGGFSLELWSYIDKSGNELKNGFRPRVGIKQIDGKRALKGFTARNGCDPSDLIPDGSPTGEPEEGYIFRGHFLDLRTLAFALTDRSYSLASACEGFEVEHGKQHAEHHGEITSEYIDYNRRDVLATAELAEKLLAEFDKHPIDLQPTKAYSPASIGKSHLQAMGIRPILERQPDFPKKYLGYAQSAFFGGRTSAHIRKVPIPVVYTDFLSMYPTVNINMGLWDFVTAQELTIDDHCEKEITDFLNCVSADHLFNPDTWKNLAAFVQIIPDDDILPSRSKYATASNDWQVGVNHMYSDAENSTALWFALPDVVASVILTGRVPKIVDAFRLKAKGKSKGLKPISLRNAIKVDPRNQDLFKVVIEERKRLDFGTDTSKSEKGRLDKALKVLANSTSYGIYAEMNRQESDEMVNVLCHGIDPEPFTCKVKHPEIPGKYCFPPLAALITSAARLMLSLLEHCVSEKGGTYAMEDTDSMAIVATERGGLIPCPGGSYLKDGQPAIKALSWNEVEEIANRFEALNPYDRDAIPGSVLKIEGDNFDPTRKQRQLYCFAISAKRYALFLKDKHGNPALLRNGVNNDEDRWSEHGLGHLLNPTDPESEDRKWAGQAWLNMVRGALSFPRANLGFEDLPAVGRVTVSSPAVIRPLAKLNEGKPYSGQIKPFNFLLTCHVKPFGHPKGADPERFHLIAPYNNNSAQWLKMDWIDQYTGNTYRITTSEYTGSARTAFVKTYGDVLREYEYHPESKCADATGDPCDKQTVGLLQRRHITVDQIKYIGKESNHLEDVDAGLVHSRESVYTEYVDQSRDEWQTKILPLLKRLPLKTLISESGLSRRALMDIRAARSRPHLKNQECLRGIAITKAKGPE
ncbi:DNA polymerase [Tunturibacter psychrotolerans]|uniref:DNA polymerase n=1 Tax=Tunturiibacter psychrotolerans TaxID=3069686 RepID=A0AAU7ZK95_9BACT